MATVHAKQALFLAKQIISSAVALGFSIALSKHFSVDHSSIYQLVFETWNTVQSFSAKIPTVLIHQTF